MAVELKVKTRIVEKPHNKRMQSDKVPATRSLCRWWEALGCKMKFQDTSVNTENRFSTGIEKESGRYYLSIPVSNSLVDYEEYYLITQEQYNQYPTNINDLINFAENCRKHHNDHLILQQPGVDRGVG